MSPQWLVLMICCGLFMTPMLASAQSQPTAPSNDRLRVLILGDSLTEGYGVDKQEAFPALLEGQLHREGYSQVQIVNGGISGSTSASGPTRMQWYLKAKPQIVVLALGANDGLRGLEVKEMERNLAQTIKIAQDKQIKILLVGMKVLPNYGKKYADEFEAVFTQLAKEFNLPLMPFLLEDVGGLPQFNQPDGVHPTAKGHEIMAKNVIKYLKPLL